MKKWLIAFNSSSEKAKARLVCFPFAGGGTINYGRWRNDLDSSIELYAFNFPGRERFLNEPCLTNYAELINECTATLNELDNLPLFLFGHSFGGLTAYLVAAQLKALHGSTVAHLYISARVPPGCDTAEKFSGLNDDEFKRILIERYQGLPPAIANDSELLKLFLPIIKKDFYMYEQYPGLFDAIPEKIIASDITTFYYNKDNPSLEQMQLWSNFTNKNHFCVEISGGHFTLLQDWKIITNKITQDCQR